MKSAPQRETCPHGKPYTYCWVWDERKGETIEHAWPEYLSTPDCQVCFPPLDDEEE
jgi:hypothetical protein